MDYSDTENIHVRLDDEEVQLMKELESLQTHIKELDPDMVHKQMLDALKTEALNSISTALDISDLMESRPETNSIYHKDVTILRDNKQHLNERRDDYVRSKMTGQEFMSGVKRIETSAKRPDGTAIHVDCYTGESLKVGNPDDKYDHEHVISAKELSESFFTGLFMSEKEIRDFANSDSNLKVTRAGINRSKGEDDLKVWLRKEHPGKPGVTNQEYYNIDPKIAEKTYDAAHQELRKRIAIKAGERAVSAAKATAINIGGYALKKSIGELLKITIVELVAEFREKRLDPLKTRIKRVVSKIKKQLGKLVSTFKEAAMNNFVATIMDAVLNVFLDTTKKLFKIVRMLWKPILNAIKTIVSPSSQYTFSDRLLAASKIIGAALVGVLGVFLDELINSALCSIPGVAIVAPYISPILSALIVGMTSALILQGYDAYKKGKQLVEYKNKEGRVICQLERISEKRASMAGFESEVIQLKTANIFAGTLTLYEQCESCIKEKRLSIHASSVSARKHIMESQNTNEEIDFIISQCK